MNFANKLILGTAKLSNQSYGFSSNANDRTDVGNFLSNIYNLGISKLDTSPRYLESEQLIGQYLEKFSEKQYSISTKLDNINTKSKCIESEIRSKFNSSLKSLKIKKIDTLYLHQNEMEIISNEKVMKVLLKLKNEGVVSNIGVSIYNKEEFNFAIESKLYTTIQFPINVFDTSYYFEIVNNLNEETLKRINLVGRSILLQGLLVNFVDAQNFKEIEDYRQRLNDIANECNLTILELSHAFLAKLKKIDNFIIGTTSLKNFESNLLAFDTDIVSETYKLLEKMSCCSKKWANPRNW